MAWSDELTRIRRYLRDPAGNIWSDAVLKTIFNDIQKEFQHKTSILENVIAMRTPPLYQLSYMYDHEWNQLPTTNSQFYQVFHYHQQSNTVCCFDWEGQVLNRVNDAAPEVGARFTQPWEAYMSLAPATYIPYRFPSNFDSLKFISFDREPIAYTTRKEIQKRDASYITHVGRPIAYYRPDDLDNSFVPYPKISDAWNDELVGGETGMVLFNSDDTVDSETGTIIVRDGTVLETQTGVSVDLINADNNILIGYNMLPDDIVDIFSTTDYPDYLNKYIEFGVLSRAYRMNNDGNIPSLGDYWDFRYQLGIKLVNQFKFKRMQDRDYRLGTQTKISKRKPHPSLPSTYPSCP